MPVPVPPAPVLPPLPPPPPLPPQPIIADESDINTTTIPNMVRQRRGRLGTPSMKTHARDAPPAAYQEIRLRGAGTTLDVGAVVETVSVAPSAAAALVMTTVLVLKLKVGGCWALAGPEVTAALRVTLPVNPLVGITETGVVAPGVPCPVVSQLASMVKPGGITGVTVTTEPTDAPV